MFDLRIVGLTELLEKERTVGAKTEGLLTEKLRQVGETVAVGTRTLYGPYSSRGAAGVTTKVLVSGVWVVQTIRKSRNTLRRRPNFGPLMMRKAFLPAAYDNQQAVLAAAQQAVDEVAATYWNT